MATIEKIISLRLEYATMCPVDYIMKKHEETYWDVVPFMFGLGVIPDV